MEHSANQIILRGKLHTLPEYSHENHDKTFFRFMIEVPRLSGTSDFLPVLAETSLIQGVPTIQGSSITVCGQIRSHNTRSEGKRHLLIFVFATSLLPDESEPLNSCQLEGILCRDPIFRRTPLGREICDIMLAVPGTFQRSNYLPCILWGKTAREVSVCHTGERIHIHGRLQSRSYTKVTETGTEKRTAYEISALEAEIISQTDS